MSFVILENSVQVSYTQTIVGWYNVRLVDAEYKKEMVTISPKQFFKVFNVSRNVTSGCCDLPISQAQLLGFKLNYVWEATEIEISA
jgi:hypothetical protein